MAYPIIPFSGNMGRLFSEPLKKIGEAIPAGTKVLDVFGGSGIVSDILKKANPKLQITWNDADNYQQLIDDKTWLLDNIFSRLNASERAIKEKLEKIWDSAS